MDDLREHVGTAGILRAAAHDANRNLGQGGNYQLAAANVLLEQAAHDPEALELLLSIDVWRSHTEGNGG